MQDKIKRIIAQMTPAQKTALKAMPVDVPFVPLDYVLQKTTAMALKKHQLIRPVKTDDLGPRAMSIVTPLGKGVLNLMGSSQ